MTETTDQADGTAAAGWGCEAYGPEGKAVGALCFVAGDLGARVCGTEGECRERMAGERQRAFRRINELAAAGDPDFAYLAEQFTSPDQLLGGGEEPRPPVSSLVEAVKMASTHPSYGVARLECAPDVVGYLHTVAAEEEPPAPPWQPTVYWLPPGSVPVVVDAEMSAGRWRMVDADGGVVWEGTVEQPGGPGR